MSRRSIGLAGPLVDGRAGQWTIALGRRALDQTSRRHHFGTVELAEEEKEEKIDKDGKY